MKIPKEVFAGDSATWNDDPTTDILGGAIDSTWTLKYVISFPTAVTLTATTNGTGWSTTLSKVQSAVAAGDYYWQAYAETGSRRETIGTGRLTVKAAAGNAVSGKSQLQQDLDAVELAIRTLVSGGAKSYTIGGRSMTKNEIGELILWRDRLKSQIAAEKKAESIANGLGNPSNVFVRFRG